MARIAHCCFVGPRTGYSCANEASWTIQYSDQALHDTTDSCDRHVGALLSSAAINTVTKVDPALYPAPSPEAAP